MKNGKKMHQEDVYRMTLLSVNFFVYQNGIQFLWGMEGRIIDQVIKERKGSVFLIRFDPYKFSIFYFFTLSYQFF